MSNVKNSVSVLLSYRLDESFCSIFRDLGFVVLWDSNKFGVIELIKKYEFDFAIEWQESYNDYTVLNEVKKYRPHIPVLLSLNWNGKLPDNHSELLYSGYLLVPFELENLRRTIYDCLNVNKRELFKEMPIWTSENININKYNPLMQRDDYQNIKKDAFEYQRLAIEAEHLNLIGEYRAAIKLLEPYAENENNNNPSFSNELGVAYGKVGSQFQDIALWHKAYYYHKKSFNTDSNQPIYMFNLAMAALWLEEYDEAYNLFTNYIESGHKNNRKLAKQMLRKLRYIK
jgi:hypothetical protein